ncbi:MAG: hypothetical protein CVU39_01665 [Chloroflexi bacterium HGW-Chloroflexi-10]|nr:MAG: hypothetical protein CVU39_01665 [Chloroflexi bacterium HGW-Chloroflexi-10]
MNQPTYYQILGISPDAEPEAVTAAYQNLIQALYPESGATPELLARLQQINLAYNTLRNPKKRAAYDQQLQADQARSSNIEADEIDFQSGNETLVHESDFSVSSAYWEESSDETYTTRIADGYYHIHITKPRWEKFVYPDIPVTDFRAVVDCEFVEDNANGSECALLFRQSKIEDWYTYYRFGITKNGSYSLFIKLENQYTPLINYIPSAYISIDGQTNNLMVEMIGANIQLSINGVIVAKFNDKRLVQGNVGLIGAANFETSTAAVRFRNFRLYEISEG